MVQEVKLPEISENVESGEVIQLLVSEGDRIEKEQAIVELETEKAAFEVPSPAAGKVVEIAVKEGDTVNVGQLLIKVETDEAAGAEEAEAPQGEEPGQRKARAEAEQVGAPEAPEEEEPEKEKEEAKEKEDREKAGGERIQEQEKPSQKRVVAHRASPEKEEAEGHKEVAPASPSVRRLARELGIDIHRVSGSGPGGRISPDDVKRQAKRAVEGRSAAGGEAAGAAEPELPDFSRWGPIERQPMSSVRRITARNVVAAWRAIPHVTQFDRADLSAVSQFRQSYQKRVAEAGGKLTVTAILLKVLASALKVFPRFNLSLDLANEQIIYKKYIHLGVAVDTDRGLLVPVIRDVDRKTVTQVAVELTELAERTRNKKIKPDELEGATFTLSNLGGIGGTNFTPIVYHPQVAILGVARARRELVMEDGAVKAHTTLPLSLSYDHRVIDGADGARFLRWIADALENPLLIVMEGGI
jgi:pyruvate dehydrogenase E2 component (dihydrolipoamide acetyltransferase)